MSIHNTDTIPFFGVNAAAFFDHISTKRETNDQPRTYFEKHFSPRNLKNVHREKFRN